MKSNYKNLFLMMLFSIFFTNSIKAQYCVPAYTNASCAQASQDYIQSFFTTGGTTDISNLLTGCSHPDGDPNYFHYSGAGFTLTTQTNATINFSLTSTLATFPQGYRIWIDWNLDNVFDVTTEEVWNSGATVPGGGTTVTGSFVIPPNATPGLSRMRVRGRYNSMVIDPCATTYTFGECEDYDVQVMPNLPCTVPPVAGTAATDIASLCGGSNANLNLTGVSYGIGETYQWQSSPNGTTYSDIAGATSLQLPVTVNATTFYRCVVSCSGQSANSNAVTITVLNANGVITEADDSVVCQNQTINLTLQNAAAAQGFAYQWQESLDGVNYSDIIGETNEALSYVLADTTYIRCTITCGASTANSSVVLLTLNPYNQCYCGPALGNNLGGACGVNNIEDFSITSTTLNNAASGCNTTAFGAYSLFPAFGNTTGTLTQLGSYNFNLTSNGTSITSLWIDFDHSGTFDPSEWTQLSGGALPFTVANTPVTANISIPGTALVGTTLMRVRSRANGNPNGDINPCTNFGSGETEDYVITIAAAPPCTAPPTAGVAASSVDSICTGQNFNVSISGNSIGLGQTFQWQVSTNNTTWADITGETNSFASVSQTVTSFYRCALVCSGQTAYSTSVMVVNNNCLLMSTDVVTTCNTAFYDSNPTGNYSANENSTLTVYPSTPGAVIKVVFNNIAIENGFEVLNVYDGIDNTAPLLISYSGNYSQDSVQATNALGALTFEFFSDAVVQLSGWDAQISCVTVIGCNGAPTAGNAEATDSSLCENSVANLILTGNSNDFGTSFQWQSSLNGTTWVNELGAISASYNPTITDTIYYRCKLKCVNDSAFSTIVMFTISDFFECYCGPNTGSNLGGFCGGNNIDSVSISNTNLAFANTICNTTGLGAYTMFPDTASYLTATLQQLVPYNLNVVTTGNSIISVWIDYDHSGTFDANEWTQVATTSTAGGISTVSITPPVSSLTGRTGMRVRSRANGNTNGANDGCIVFGSGETEDYIVTITNALPCIAPPTAGTTIASANSVCANTDVNLSIQGNSVGIGQTYQWQESVNGTSYTDIAGETNETVTVTLGTVNMYYQCLVTCSSQSVASTSTMVAIVECYNFASGVDSVVTTCSGNFYDSGSNTGNYSPNESGTMTFTPSSANSIMQVVFNAFSVENGFESFKVYDGPTNSSPLIGQFTNTNQPDTITATSLNGSLTFEFTSDGSVQQFGWSASLNCIAANACAGAPVGGNAVAADSSVCENSNVSLSLLGNTTGTGITYQWQESANGLTYTDIAGATTALASFTVLDTTYYRCNITCGVSNITTPSTAVMVTFNLFYDCYCGPNTTANIGGFCGGNNMDTVIIVSTTLNNASACNTTAFGAYSSYPASGSTTATLQQLVPYQLYVTNTGNSIQSVWIDYDHSGTFDANEWQQISTTSVAGVASTITINIPVNSLTGITGMRLRSRGALNQNGANDGCLVMGSGETEDYIITITPASPCVAPPTAGTAIASTASSCLGVAFDVMLQGASAGSGQTYQWQSSDNNTTWADIANETNPTLTTTQDSATYYRCVLTCSAISASSVSVMVGDGCIVMSNDTVYTCSSSFYDSGTLSSNYSNNENYTLTIYPGTPGNAVSVLFNSFNTESGYDGLSIYDGTDATAPIIPSGLPAGFNAPADSWYGLNTPYSDVNFPGVVTASFSNPTGALTFVFTSDGSVVRAGWDATVSCVAVPACIAPPTAGTISAAATSVCIGESTVLSTTGQTIGSGLTYQWWESASATGTFTPIATATTPTLSVSPLMTMYYKLQITCSGQSALSNIETVVVNCYTMSNNTITTCSGTLYDSNPTGNYQNSEAYTLTINPGTPGNNVQLLFNTFNTENGYDSLYVFSGSTATGTPLAALSGNLGALPAITSTSGPLTLVFLSDATGTRPGWNATISCVPQTGCVTPVITATTSTTICANQTVTLVSNIPTVSWTTPTSTGVLTGASIVVSDAGAYFATSTVAGCTTITSNIINVAVNALPIPVVTSTNPTFCDGDSAMFVANSAVGGPNFTYMWTGVTSSTGATAYSSNSSNVSVMMMNTTTGCSATSTATNVTENQLPAAPVLTPSTPNAVLCPNGSVVLSSSYASGNVWSSAETTSSINVVSGGTYTDTYMDVNGCMSTSSITVVLLPTPTVSVLSGTTTFCQGIGSVVLGSNAIIANVWNNTQASTTNSITVTTAGSYNVTINPFAGCSITSNSIVVTVNTPVVPVVTSNVAAICGSAVANLTSTTNASYISYTWSSNVQSSISNTAVANVAGLYTCTIVDVNGCSATSASLTIGVGTAPTPVLTASGATTVCEPGCITLSTAAGQGAYVWYQNGTINSALGTSPSITVCITGNFSVEASNNGCSGISSQTPIVINPQPNAAFSFAAISTGVPPNVNSCTGIIAFTNASTNSSTFQWNFGDNSPQVPFTSPGHTYTDGGNYTVTLVAQNACGSDTSALTFNVCSTVGIEDVAVVASDVNIYPNPTKDNLTIALNNLDANNIKLEVMTVAGQVIYTEKETNLHGKFNQNIDMSKYAQGVYFVRIVTDKTTISRKVVKE